MIAQAAIEDHGLIGDLQTAALVATDGTIDWYCCPRSDSPSVFGAILDSDKGGHVRIAPDGVSYRSKQLYLGLRFLEEAQSFGRWLSDRVAEQADDGSGPLKIMYRVDGTSDLQEEILDHLDGWRGSRPVRIGNGAADQRQLDIYGEAADAIYLAVINGAGVAHQGWLNLSKIVDWVCEHWDEREEGIWETRGGRQDFTFGRFQAWIAPSASPDGLRGSEGTFTMCSFWYVDTLARSGYLEQARMVFEKMLTYSNHLGLYAEEIGLTGEHLGNFPQAFSHLALINAAINLDYQLEHGAARVGVVRTSGR